MNDLTYLEWKMISLFMFCFVTRQSIWTPLQYCLSVGFVPPESG